MRLLIAGILSLVIYIMTCGYKNEDKAEEMTSPTTHWEQHDTDKMDGLYHFIIYPDFSKDEIPIPYRLKNDEPAGTNC